ncbi:hypothetical protein INR49_030723 [Caranx melampygus]|nr:hypothetical protein INR49_030723 [Caranx melampygus]
MEKQVNMDMTYKEAAQDEDEQVEEMMEDQFLKGLYLFMRKRDTPIERIPHLGFKQIDLFLMYKIVGEFGGYYKVTSQQLWKQVYNRLGGNPRSTSAATCTRRHYEKLLLPYECHLKGIAMNTVPPLQQKHFLYANYTNDNCDDPRPAKRKALSLQMHQSPTDLQSDHHGGVFSQPLHFPHFYPSSHKVLPQYVPISSPPMLASTQLPSPRMPSLQTPAPESNFSLHQPHLSPTERTKEPLEHLRHLAEQYKTSSGLMEPLNLSVKASSQETNRSPVSSFAPPSSSKTPKFLNKPSPLYTARCPEGARSNGCETEDEVDADAGVSLYSYPAKSSKAYVMDVKPTASSNSPMHVSPRADEGTAATAQKPSSSPKTDFTIWSRQEKEGSPEGRWLGPAHLPPGLPQVNGGKMEIQIPLSVLHNWLKVYGSSATVAKQLQTPKTEEEGQSGQGNSYEPTGQTFHTHSRHHWSPAAGDLQLRQRNSSTPPTPTATPQTSSVHHNMSQNHFSMSSSSSKSLPSGGSLKRSYSPDTDPEDLIKSYRSYWESYNKEPHVKTSSSPIMLQQDLAPAKSHGNDTSRGVRGRSEPGHSPTFMLNSSAGAVLQLTTEEVMKLKKMISSSS